MKIIAHRGASGYFPENTLPAFQAAVDLASPSVEFDVQQTRDKALAVLHDPDLRRLSGSPARVADLAFSELRQHDAGAWFSPRFKGVRVPGLDEVLALLLRARLEIHLEIKQGHEPSPGIEGRVLEALRSRPGAMDSTVVSSLDHPTLRRLRSLDPGLRLGYLDGRAPAREALCEAESLGCESVHVSARRLDDEWVSLAKGKGLKLLVYTVDDPAEAGRLRGLGAAGVFSNFPDLMRGRGRVGGTE
jgi:glycerophosphoryl diester phosphodiesterase